MKLFKAILVTVVIVLLSINIFLLTRDTGSESYLIGDVNMDGVVNSLDVLYIKRDILDIKKLTPEGKKLADYNQDSSVDQEDIDLLADYIISQY